MPKRSAAMSHALTSRPPRGKLLAMKPEERNKALAADLTTMLAKACPGITVSVEPSKRWDRPCVMFAWAGFAGLLPEERYQRLVTAIPTEFREKRLKGFVWLELAPAESTEEFLKLPRSDEVANKEAGVFASLLGAGFFESLRKALGRDPRKDCPGDFSTTAAVLSAKKCSAAKVRDAKLVFIRHGAFCDCQVLATVEPALAKRYPSGG